MACRYQRVLLADDHDRGYVDTPRVDEAIKISRNLSRDDSSGDPEVPPAERTEDHRSQRRWTVQQKSRDRTVGSNMQRGGRPDAAAGHKDTMIAGDFPQCVISRESGWRDGADGGAP